MKQIKSYDDFLNEEIKFNKIPDFESINKFNKIPDFEFTNKVKTIKIDINGEKIEALVGAKNALANTGYEIIPDDTFYFKTDKENTEKLKNLGIMGVEFIDTVEDKITFKTEDGTSTYNFKVVLFSKQELKKWEGEEGEYVTWKM